MGLRWTRAMAFGGTLGVGLGTLPRLLGAAPGELVQWLAAMAIGWAIGAHFHGEGVRVRAGALALGALFSTVALGDRVLAGVLANDSELAAGVLGLLTGGAWGAGLGALSAGPASLLFAGVALWAAGFLPVLGVLGAAVVLGLAGPSRRAAPSWGADAVGIGACAALGTATWNAGRANLDPTPEGLSLFLAATLAWAALSVAVTSRTISRGGAASWLGAAALASVLGLALLPVQSWRVLQPAAGVADPRHLLQGMTVLLAGPTGWATGIWMRKAQGCAPLAAVAAAGGAWLGVRTGADTGTWLLALAFLSAFPGAIRRGTGRRRLASAAVLAAAILVGLQSGFFPATELGEGRATWLGETTAPARGQVQVADEELAVSWGPGGASLVRVSKSGVRLDLDGTRVQPGSRAVAADSLAPHLAGALVAHRGDALVHGDSLGHLAAGLVLQGFSRVSVVTRNVEGIRQQAALDPNLSETLLHPAVHLERAAFEVRLQSRNAWDLVLEVARTPWLDAAGGLPDAAQFQRRERALGEGGLYLLVATITRLEEMRFRELIHDFGGAFGSAWVLLPPNGADQVLLAGWRTHPAVSWNSFLAAYERGALPLANLDIRSPMDLADRVLAGNDLLMELAAEEAGRRPMGLGSRLHKRPSLLLPLLHDQVRGPAGMLADDTSEAVLELLAARAETQQTFLKLLSQTTTGDMKEVFENSRRLLEQTGGARALEPVIAPYLDAARKAIAQGVAEGPSSPAWTRAQGSLATAQLPHPKSPALLTLQGETLLAQGNLARAAESFTAAERVESGRVDALHGLARVAMQRGKPREAERYLVRARDRNPVEWSAAYNLGVFLSQEGRYAEAEEHLRKSSQLAGKDQAAPHAALSQLYLGMGQPTRALVEASLAATQSPTALHHSLRGKAFYEVDQVDAAATAFQEAILLDPGHWQARAGMGLVYARKGEFGRCVQAFQGVLAADPGNPAATENLRRCEEARQGD